MKGLAGGSQPHQQPQTTCAWSTKWWKVDSSWSVDRALTKHQSQATFHASEWHWKEAAKAGSRMWGNSQRSPVAGKSQVSLSSCKWARCMPEQSVKPQETSRNTMLHNQPFKCFKRFKYASNAISSAHTGMHCMYQHILDILMLQSAKCTCKPKTCSLFFPMDLWHAKKLQSSFSKTLKNFQQNFKDFFPGYELKADEPEATPALCCRMAAHHPHCILVFHAGDMVKGLHWNAPADQARWVHKERPKANQPRSRPNWSAQSLLQMLRVQAAKDLMALVPTCSEWPQRNWWLQAHVTFSNSSDRQ